MSKWIMYEYRCDTCSHHFESLQQPDATSVECPKCGADAPRALSPGAQCDWMQKSLWMDGRGTAHDRFERTRRKQRRQEQKNLENHGVEFDRTPGG